METEKVFWVVPTTIECKVVEGIMIKELTKLEKQLMIEDSINFPQ